MYSQNNEEQVILSYFGNKIGNLLDIGANDAAAAVARRQNINNSQSMNNYQVAALINQ